MTRLGMTIPIQILPIPEHRDLVCEIADLGYTDVWTSEAQDLDGFVPLALTAAWEPRLRLGCACFPAQTRGPATFAMSAAALALAAPGRVAIGIGSSSEWIVRIQNGLPFERPLARVRDTARFLRAALAGESGAGDYETFSSHGFRLLRKPEPPPSLLIAALRARMLALAGAESDGVILNYVGPDDLPRVLPIVRDAAREAGRPPPEIALRLYVCPTTDAERVRAIARRSIAAYFNVPTYRAHQEWLGHAELFGPMWERWAAGDRKGAVAAIPDEAVDRFYIHGAPEACLERIEAFREAGVDTPILALVEEAMDPREAIRRLAPR